MNKEIFDAFWNPSFETLYEAYFQELASGVLIKRWKYIHIVIAILVASTASGSAIAGWALWSEPVWKSLWTFFAGIASIASIVQGVLGVPEKVREQESLRQLFSELRVDAETFRQKLVIYREITQADSVHQKLRERLSDLIGRTHPDIAFTIGLRKKVQNQLNSALREKGYIL